MHLHRPTAEVFIPDGLGQPEALARITHLGIGAHQDDLEFMAFHGIIACYAHAEQWFGGVTCTDGVGSVRSGAYAGESDATLAALRRQEQKRAAQIGQYAAIIQLGHPSAAVRDPADRTLRDDLAAILRATRPQIVYTHNLADKHPTHIDVALAAIDTLRALPSADRPAAVHGCEVWRSLDWLPDADKVLHDLGGHDNLARALNAVFESQNASGKRYDLAVIGRRHANATFIDPHAIDPAGSLAFAMDLTPLIRDESLDPVAYVDAYLERFRDEVLGALKRGRG